MDRPAVLFTRLKEERHTTITPKRHTRRVQRALPQLEAVMLTVANELLNRVKHEYVEMPGLVLTSRQASRLWNLDVGVCEVLLSALVREDFLSQTRGGAYLRRGTESLDTRPYVP